MEGSCLRPPLTFLSPLTAAVLLVVSVWQAPHTVHHLLEQGADQQGCLVAASAERTPAMAADTAVITVIDTTGHRLNAAGLPAVAAPPTSRFTARAPPRPSA